MAESDYIPSREEELAAWFANFASKLPSYSTLLGISAGDLSRVSGAAPFMAGIFDALDAAKQEAKEWTAFKNLEVFGPAGGPTPAVPSNPPPPALSPVAPGIIPAIRDIVRKLKVHVNYTTVIGQDLGIIGSTIPVPLVPKPTGSVTSDGSFTATVKFKKAGFDGVEVQGQRATETTWVRIATDSYSPYVDNRPPLVAGVPEERRYRLRYLVLDEPTGEFSDVMSVVVGA